MAAAAAAGGPPEQSAPRRQAATSTPRGGETSQPALRGRWDRLAARRDLTQRRRELEREARCARCNGTGRGRRALPTGLDGAGELRQATCADCLGTRRFPSGRWLRLWMEYDQLLREEDEIEPGFDPDCHARTLEMVASWPGVAEVNRVAEGWIAGRFGRGGGRAALMVLLVERVGLHEEPDGRERPVIWARLYGVDEAPRLHLLCDPAPASVEPGDLVAAIIRDEGRRHYARAHGYDALTAAFDLVAARRLMRPAGAAP